jgi:hypothetical protein
MNTISTMVDVVERHLGVHGNGMALFSTFVLQADTVTCIAARIQLFTDELLAFSRIYRSTLVQP